MNRPSTLDSIPDRLRDRPATTSVLAITALALLVRLWGLGSRVAHQDEARVAYWAYRYMETGVWEYRPIVHGPFLTQVDAGVFALLGANDFTMRLVVALVGGLLPLVALLFRERLRGSEQVALALVLAANPLLLYYSRFMRNDVLLAGFMLAALGFFVRTLDTRQARYLFAGVAAFALAFTTKENALVYPVAWAGAALLLFDHRLYDDRGAGWTGAARRRLSRTVRGLWTWRWYLLLAVLEFAVIVVFFYAPRTPGTADPGLWTALGNPSLLPGVVEEATVGSWEKFVGQWGGGNENSYLEYFESLLSVYAVGAPVLLGLSVVGFVADRYAGDRPRDVPAFCFYWGVASFLGYPVIVDNAFPWEAVHVVVPLAVPAAVGLALVYRWGRRAGRAEDPYRALAAAIVLVAAAGAVAGTAYATSFEHPQSPDNEIVQYAQSQSDLKATLAEIDRTTADEERTDVLFYGNEFYSPDESAHEVAPAGPGWFDRLPLAWYFLADGIATNSTNDPAELEGNPPPVVVALGSAGTCSDDYDHAGEITPYLDGYDRHDIHRYGYDSGCTVSKVVVFVE
jgi:uncharacterized protein (TIGR03663 family)